MLYFQFLTFVAQIYCMRFLLFLVLCSAAVGAQIRNKTDSNRVKPGDTLVIDSGFKDSLKVFKPTIQDYSWQTRFSDKKVFDTVLTADKTFIFSQYNNQDNFGRVPFANVGAGFQPLIFSHNAEQDLALLPVRKSFLLRTADEIKYYDVKTPTTAFVYHNAMRNGAVLQSTYTQNIGKQFNFAIEYTGLRSQGFYQNSLAANNNTQLSAHYESPNGKYRAFGHFLHTNINNQENGGIADVDLFLNDASDFNNRENIPVNLTTANSRFAYRRFYYRHEFRPFSSERFPFRLRHTIYRQSNKYYFSQEQPEPFLSSSPDDLIPYPLSSKKYYVNLSNTVSALLDTQNFLLEAGVRHQHIVLGIGDALSETFGIPLKQSEERLGVVGELQMNLWERVALNAGLEISGGKEFGSFIRSRNNLRFEPIPDYAVTAHVNFQSGSPTFNLLLNPSVYRQFNYRLTDPKNEQITEVGGQLGLKWFNTVAMANFIRVENYTYLNAAAQPQQSTDALSISQLGGEATFSWGKFHLNPRVLFQSALSRKDLYPMPAFIGRANLYWQSRVFKGAAEVQAGLKAYYFSRFNSREFSPVLNEFILPGATGYAIGGKPIADVYVNLKVKKMFFFIEGQHFNAALTGNKSFAAPYYPVSDFRLNLGIVWYLFS